MKRKGFSTYRYPIHRHRGDLIAVVGGNGGGAAGVGFDIGVVHFCFYSLWDRYVWGGLIDGG